MRDNEQTTISEDRATQPMEAGGWVSQFAFRCRVNILATFGVDLGGGISKCLSADTRYYTRHLSDMTRKLLKIRLLRQSSWSHLQNQFEITTKTWKESFDKLSLARCCSFTVLWDLFQKHTSREPLRRQRTEEKSEKQTAQEESHAFKQ